MGTSHSFAEFGAKLRRLEADLDDIPKTVVPEAAQLVQRATTARAPSRLRNAGKNGARLGVRINGGTFGGEPKALVYATGPWQLIERGTKPHPIPRLKGSYSGARGLRAQRSKKGRMYGPAFGGMKTGSRVKVLHFANGGFAAHVFHPGTSGKHPWAQGVEASVPVVNHMLESRGDLVLRRIF